MPARMIPNVASLEKHLMTYRPLLRKQHYGHFKTCILGIVEGADSMVALSRKSGVSDRTLWHFFHEVFFDDEALLTKSATGTGITSNR